MSKAFPSISLFSENDTAALAVRLADKARPGDVFLLEGDIGVGKTTFARYFIQRLAGNVEVLSPTFTLVQSYPYDKGYIHHYDLYRIVTQNELDELGLYDHLHESISLIEWPCGLGKYTIDRFLKLIFSLQNNKRTAVLWAEGEWGQLENYT